MQSEQYTIVYIYTINYINVQHLPNDQNQTEQYFVQYDIVQFDFAQLNLVQFAFVQISLI